MLGGGDDATGLHEIAAVCGCVNRRDEVVEERRVGAAHQASS